jgi:hypothetical protein
MARVREALRGADNIRSLSPALPPTEEKAAPLAEEEIPFIEVGGPGSSLEASPSVLASQPIRAIAASPSFCFQIHTGS